MSDALAFFVGGFNRDCSVRINNIDSPTKIAKTIRKNISCYFCSSKQHTMLIGFAWQWKCFQQRLSNKSLGHQIGNEIEVSKNFRRTRADGSNLGGFSRAYLHHLDRCGEMLGPMLASIHNLHYYLNLMREVRESLDAGQFSQFRAQFKTERARGV